MNRVERSAILVDARKHTLVKYFAKNEPLCAEACSFPPSRFVHQRSPRHPVGDQDCKRARAPLLIITTSAISQENLAAYPAEFMTEGQATIAQFVTCRSKVGGLGLKVAPVLEGAPCCCLWWAAVGSLLKDFLLGGYGG